MPSKETLCSKCIHLQVCSYKKLFAAAQTEVENVDVTCQDDENCMVVHITDITFLKPVQLQCIYNVPTISGEKLFINSAVRKY